MPNGNSLCRQRSGILTCQWSEKTQFLLRFGEQTSRSDDNPSYCVDGKVTADGHPAAMDFDLTIKGLSGFAPINGAEGSIFTRVGADVRLRNAMLIRRAGGVE